MHERTFRGLSACAVLSVVCFGSRVLRAQALEPTLLSYRAPDGCPDSRDFERSVQRRSTRVRFVEDGAHDRELSIVVRRSGEVTHGELRLVERDGRTSQRNVRFTTCAEAVEGLALIAVVSLDPQALLEAKPAPGDAPATATTSEPAPPPPPPAQPKPTSKSAVIDPPLATQQTARHRFALGATFNVAPRALPATALGGSLFMDFAFGTESVFAPLFRAAVSHVERRGLPSETGAEGHFTLTLATLLVCPMRLSSGFLTFHPCAFGSGGALYAWGTDTTNLQQRTRPYGALGGSALLFARATRAIDIVADLALGATLVRDSFGFEQDQPWRTPGLYLSSGIGARFGFQ